MFKIVNTNHNIVVPKMEFPFFAKAHRLAHCLSEKDVDDLLNGKRHIHTNPKKKPKSPVTEFYPATEQ